MHLHKTPAISLVARVVAAALMMSAALPGAMASANAQTSGARPPVPGAPAGVMAFVDVNVVPMDRDRLLLGQTVLVQSGRITALGPSDKIQIPAGASRIDGQGRYLIPGLGDMHVHLNAFASPTAALGIERDLLLRWLADGVTMIRNMDYDPDPQRIENNADTVVLRLRAEAAAGTRLIPRIYTSGAWAPAAHYIGASPSHPPPLDSVAFHVAAYKAKGFDFLKIHNERPEVYDSVTAAARRIGLSFEGHVPEEQVRVPLAQVLASGQRSIEHLTGYMRDESRPPHSGEIDGMVPGDTAHLSEIAAATRRAGVWHCPTLTILLSRAQNAPDRYVPHAVVERWVKGLHDAGVKMLLGTDNWHPGPSVQDELDALVAAGLSPYEALVTGTRNVAEFVGWLNEIGTVTAGKRADLVLLDGNPLENIRNTRDPAGVMIGGRWTTRAGFEQHATELAAFITPGKEYTARAYMKAVALVKALSLTDAQRSAFRQLATAQSTQHRALRDSLGSSVDSTSGQQRELQLIARQIAEFRAQLTTEQLAVLDPGLRRWQAARGQENFPVVIPGVGQ